MLAKGPAQTAHYFVWTGLFVSKLTPTESGVIPNRDPLHFTIGKLVVDLISDSATVEFTS